MKPVVSDVFRTVEFGVPTVGAGSVLGMLAIVILSTVVSAGKYYRCARVAGLPPPPTHALSRGIRTTYSTVVLTYLLTYLLTYVCLAQCTLSRFVLRSVAD